MTPPIVGDVAPEMRGHQLEYAVALERCEGVSQTLAIEMVIG
jgi:hypothetical protein